MFMGSGRPSMVHRPDVHSECFLTHGASGLDTKDSIPPPHVFGLKGRDQSAQVEVGDVARHHERSPKLAVAQ